MEMAQSQPMALPLLCQRKVVWRGEVLPVCRRRDEKRGNGWGLS